MTEHAEKIKTPKLQIQTNLDSLTSIITESSTQSADIPQDKVSEQPLSTENADKWKMIIMNLTQKLRHMEELQRTQSEEMKKFVKRDAATIRSYKIEIRRLKKENKILLQHEQQLKHEIQKANEIKNAIEN